MEVLRKIKKGTDKYIKYRSVRLNLFDFKNALCETAHLL